MSFFDDAGAWFDQAGKDIGEAVQDAGEWFHETQDTIVNDVVFGDVADTIIGVQDDISHTLYNILHPNNPAASSVVDRIENQRPDYVAEPDFGGPVPALPSPIDGPDFGAPVDALPTPDPGPDFGAPVDALPSPEFKTFDSLTNVEIADDRDPIFQATLDRLTNAHFAGWDGDVEFADDRDPNFLANLDQLANEFTGGNGFDMWWGLPWGNGGWMTAEPVTEITGFPLGQTITFEESGMDGLVAAGPFDAVTLNEPQNNNVS